MDAEHQQQALGRVGRQQQAVGWRHTCRSGTGAQRREEARGQTIFGSGARGGGERSRWGVLLMGIHSSVAVPGPL
jgi:hypothetical protein